MWFRLYFSFLLTLQPATIRITPPPISTGTGQLSEPVCGILSGVELDESEPDELLSGMLELLSVLLELSDLYVFSIRNSLSLLLVTTV